MSLNRLCSLLLPFLCRFLSLLALYVLTLMSKHIALSTQSVGVGPGRCHALDLPLLPEPNRLSLVARFETSRLDLHARVSF